MAWRAQRPPFAGHVPVRGVIWLEPHLTAEISYAEILPGGSLRAGVFRGFVRRDDRFGD